MTDLDIPDALPVLGMSGLATLGLVWAIGPSIKALGKNLGAFTEYHTANLLHLSEKVQRRLGGEEPDDDLSVHPRVAKEVIDTGAWIDDDLQQEYLAGLLVSSRSPDGKDDGGVYYTRMLSNLTASQVRVHHAIYSAYAGSRHKPGMEHLSFTRPLDLERLTVSANLDSWYRVASGGAAADAAIARTAFDGLYRERLTRDMLHGSGNTDTTRFQVIPSAIGATVFALAMFTPSVHADAIRYSPEELAATNPALRYAGPANAYPALEDVRIGAMS